MQEQLLSTLIASKNEAADDVLLEAVRLGDSTERARALEALLIRKTQTGTFGLLRMLETLPHDLKLTLIQRAGDLYHHLPEAGRSEDLALRVAAVHLIALSRLGKFCYVLSENLHHQDEKVATAAVDALVSLSRHVASATRRLQGGRLDPEERKKEYTHLLDIRPEIEATIFRAMDVHKGSKTPELVRAALLVCDHPASKSLSILSTSRHGGVSPLVKRLQQAPDAEHVDAFLLGATHGQLRSQFALSFGAIDSPTVLDALLRRSYLLKDHRLEICMRQVSRGTWWGDGSLVKDLARHSAPDAARVSDFIAASGAHDVVQDQKLIKVHESVQDNLHARLRLLRHIIRRPRGASLTLLRRFLDDPDPMLQRIATREIVRRKPADYNTVLLGIMKTGPESVRKVAARAISAGAFDQFYERFERLDVATRGRAGKAVFKLLPDAVMRLGRKLRSGPPEQRIKALSVTQELDLSNALREDILGLTTHESAKVRSKAVIVAGTLKEPVPDVLLEKALSDPDGRVRANAIEVLEVLKKGEYLPLLAKRAKSANNRERANAIKAMAALKVEAAAPHLMLMLRDNRPEHRISALWAARHVGVYKLLEEVVRLAKVEQDGKVRRYALASVRMVASKVKEFQLQGVSLAHPPSPAPISPSSASAVVAAPVRPDMTSSATVSMPPPTTYTAGTTPHRPASDGMARVLKPAGQNPPPPIPPPPTRKAG